MPGLYLYTSARLENLFEKLAGILRAPLPDPFAAETVIVQNRGMERFLAMRLADATGICANVRFPFPNAFVQEVFRGLFPSLPAESPFSPDALAWKIMDLLPGLCRKDPAFAPIAGYLAGDDAGLKRFQLAGNIADLFDQYLMFRPEWVRKWEAGDQAVTGDTWQASLWRAITGVIDPAWHRAALIKAFAGKVRGQIRIPGLPERIFVFGIPALPPFHIDVLAGLALHTDVHCLVLNPCREYWLDIITAQEEYRRTRKSPEAGQKHHFDLGNPLLASMGKLGADFLGQLFGRDPVHDNLDATDVPEAPGTLLQWIQNDILAMVRRGQPKQVVDQDNCSVQIHSCHSPMREIEVLYDNLLDLFERVPGLEPQDVLVMAPDIEQHAPYIQAVFGTPENEDMRCPFSIADRKAADTSTVIEVFFAILELARGRFTNAEVMEVLENGAVLEKFGLSPDDLPVIRRWMDDTRIRFGIDGAHKSRLGLPPTRPNTWIHGLSRMLLGYAMPGNESFLFKGELPYDNIEGSQAEVLGKLCEFLARLSAAAAYADRELELREWSDCVTTGVVDAFFPENPGAEREIQLIRNALNKMSSLGSGQKVRFEVVMAWLRKMLSEDHFQQGFLKKGVTFCTLLPMRSVPFRVVCLLGMNDADYPRETRRLGFDLMAVPGPARPGDRSRRDDDRYIFLEALISARDVFYISYTGQDIRDNAESPPSVLVCELADYVESGFTVERPILRKHWLQPFNPRYFAPDTGLFSFSHDHCLALRRSLRPRIEAGPLVTAIPGEPEQARLTTGIRDFVMFFQNPAKALLEKRLGIFYREKPDLEEKEPFRVDPLDAYFVYEDGARALLEGRPAAPQYEITREQGILPHANPGRAVFSGLLEGVGALRGTVSAWTKGRSAASMPVLLEKNGITISGTLENLFDGTQLIILPAALKPKHLVRAWILHLCLNMGAKGRTVLICRNRTVTFRPPDDTPGILDVLCGWFKQGLRKPFLFFPESAYEYARMRRGLKKSGRPPLEAAAEKWDARDPYLKTCFGEVPPLSRQFEENALAFFGPLFDHDETL